MEREGQQRDARRHRGSTGENAHGKTWQQGQQPSGDAKDQAGMIKRAKIVATLGPASCAPDRLRELISAGMDVARVNMSHGAQESHAETIQTTRAIAAELGAPIAILLDLCGPKIRTGLLRDHRPVNLQEGRELTITTRDVIGDSSVISTGYAHLPQDLKVGDWILLADGMIELQVEQVVQSDVICRVINGGELGEH